MDFTLTDEQLAISELTGRILSEKLPPERLKRIEAGDEPVPTDVWAELARADLLGLCLPEEHGGGGYGFFELALLLEAVGANAAPLPLLATIGLAARPIAEFGDADLQATLLPGVISGEHVLTAAVAERNRGVPPRQPETIARLSGDRWSLTGTKTLVPAAELAHRMLVSATSDDGVAVFVVDPTAAGVELVANRAITGETLHTVNFDGTEADVLGRVDEGPEILERIVQFLTAGLCAMQAGVCETATRLTGTYASERKQFDAPIATFQAVAHRVADAYIDTEAVRLTARRAAWALDADEGVDEALAIAGFWAADGAHRVVHAAQHVHAGIGVDTDYPVHRFYRWAKHLEFSAGHATDHLRDLGRLIAAAS